MHRRTLLQLGAMGTTTLLVPKLAISAGNVSVIEASVADLQAAMISGKLTSKQLTQMYLDRIAAFDRRGPKINSIIELNPDALAIAAASDAARKAGRFAGAMHGIAVLLKDNIATADKMSTSAGSFALVGVRATRDAFLVEQLRKAGAVIIGKTNLSEWANIRSTKSTSGWSSRGGLTKNPYALDRNTSGSSSGSAAAIAASFAAVAVGTETDGSITSPASINGLVGLKPTVGLISRKGVVPISHSQDTAGPMARTVADAAVLLNAMVGEDPRDAASKGSAAKIVDYTKALDSNGLRGARLGVARNFFGTHDGVLALMDAALAVCKAQGATLVECELPNADKYGETELDVLLTEFKADLADYLAEFAPTAAVKNLADVIAFNQSHREQVMPYFGQELFIQAQAKSGLDGKGYLDALAHGHRYSRQEGIDKVLRESKVDALIAPTCGPAWLTDQINGDNSGNSFTSPAAVAGYPHITVPMGFVSGLPVGLSIVSSAYLESKLFSYGFCFEQATKHRRAPWFAATAKMQR
jgi:amidase